MQTPRFFSGLALHNNQQFLSILAQKGVVCGQPMDGLIFAFAGRFRQNGCPEDLRNFPA